MSGYLTHLKTMLVEATKLTFDEQYPEADFQSLHVSIEYPVDVQNYPGIWVDYDDTQQLQIAGIKHREIWVDANDVQHVGTRWRFAGVATFTIVALTSLERDRLYDEMVRMMMAAGDTDAPEVAQFRAYVEANEFIACNFDFDQIQPRGNSAAPGTPWGTDEIIYEKSLDMEVIGEFVSAGSTQDLVPLTAIVVTGHDLADPADVDNQPDVPGATGIYAWQ